MRKIIRSCVDLIAIVVIIYFLYTIVYRMTFSLGQNARRFAFAELYLILPTALAIFWILFRFLWNIKKMPVSLGNVFPESKTKLSGTQYLTFVMILAFIFVCLLNSFSFLMRIIL